MSISSTHQRVEISRLQQDLVAFDNIKNRFSVTEWAQINKKYPNAYKVINILIESTTSAIRKMEQ